MVGAPGWAVLCAYYLAVEGYQVTVFEKHPVPGGMLSLGILPSVWKGHINAAGNWIY